MKTIDFDAVAELYDAYVTADFDIGFYKKLLKPCAGKCLELMCGTGRISVPLLKDGVDLTCVDYSEAMLNVLKKKARALETMPRIECQDVCNLDLNEQYAFIFIAFNSFSEICDAARQKKALQRINEHLADGGTYFCTLYNPEYRIKSADGQRRLLGEYAIGGHKTLKVSYTNTFEPGTKRITGTQYYEILDGNKDLIEQRAMDIRFSLVTMDAFTEMARNAGFSIKEVYGDYDFSPWDGKSRYMNFVLTKPGA